MTALGTWERVGSVRVDTGTVLIADPCSVLHDDDLNKNFGKDWGAYCKRASSVWKKSRLAAASIGPPELAVLAMTGYGDGTYEVWGRFADLMCLEIRMTFDGTFCRMGGEPASHCEVQGCGAKAEYGCDAPVKSGKGWRDCNRAVCSKHLREPADEDSGSHACPEHGEPVAKSVKKFAAPRARFKRAVTKSNG